ncbi:MAG: DUF3426 domain-containing protein [Cellvibrionaceae bacterium]
MADRVTCCPHCSTSFRITDDQLQTAKGAVRCGSCLQIFRALDHLLEEEDGTDETASVGPSPDSEPSIPELDDFSDDALISDDMDKIEDTQNVALGELSEDFLQQGSFGESKGSLFDREIKVNDTSDSDHTDESWAVNLLDEIDEEESTSHSQNASEGASESEAPQIHETVHDLDEEDHEYHRSTTGSFDALSDSDLEGEFDEPTSARKEPIFNVTGERSLEQASETSHSAEEDLSALFEDEGGEQNNSAADDHDALLQGIAPAPVEMEWHPEGSRLPKQLMWGSLSLLTIALLGAQFLWFNFEEYSRKQPWRDGFAQICPLINCQLPSLAAPEKVKAYNLVVRSHPRAEHALIIDSILLNNANFEQPFPDFTLAFSNLQGKSLAYRRFSPSEYLGGEMAGVTQMPVGQPVHISLEIVDPGADAVNYKALIPLD